MNTTTYTWDIGAGLPVVLQENSVRYIWGAHGLIAQVDATPDWHYYHADGLGSTLAITDDVGAVEQTYEYDVYGAVTGGSGSLDNSFQFAGEQLDGSTGLQYLRARYYDMETGRFVSRDPLASGIGWSSSAFGYAEANPPNMTDPTGLCSWWVVDCVDDLGGAIVTASEAAGGAVLRKGGEALGYVGESLMETLESSGLDPITLIQLADLFPIAEVCTGVLAVTLSPAGAAVGAIGCIALESVVGYAAAEAFLYQLGTSGCNGAQQAGGAAILAPNFILDNYQPLGGEYIEIVAFLAGNELLKHCGEK